MLKKSLLTLVFLGLVLVPIVGVKVLQIQALIASGADFEMPPEYVTSATITEESWVQTLDAVGTITAVQGVMVSPEVAGKVSQIHFVSGQTVEQGQLLFELDTSTEEAQLAAAEADAQLAKINRDRAQKLVASHTVAEAELDTAEATFLSAEAQVENLEAVIAKRRIVAPFAGRLGIRQIDLGQFVNSGDPVVSLQSLDPVYVDFSFPQKWVSSVETGMTVEIRVDSFPGSIFSGKLSAINPEVDVTTRTIGLRATLENPGSKLLPGMFVQTAVILPEEKSYKVVPATAIVYASYGDSIFVIRETDGDLFVEQQIVQVGEARGDFVSLLSGPEPGSTIVSTGAFKLRDGMRVAVNNDLAPKAEIDPNPSDS